MTDVRKDLIERENPQTRFRLCSLQYLRIVCRAAGSPLDQRSGLVGRVEVL